MKKIYEQYFEILSNVKTREEKEKLWPASSRPFLT